jgi:hypothetical protein
MTEPTYHARCKGCGAQSNTYKIITHEPMCNAILKKPTPDPTLLNSEISHLYTLVRAGKDPDTGNLHITEEEFTESIKNLLLEARKELANDIKNDPVLKANGIVQEGNTLVKTIERLAQLQEMLK